MWRLQRANFRPQLCGGGQDAFIVKIGNLSGSTYPMTYFTYLGGSGNDIGQDIKVDSVQAVHVVGSTTSDGQLPHTINTFQPPKARTTEACTAGGRRLRRADFNHIGGHMLAHR